MLNTRVCIITSVIAFCANDGRAFALWFALGQKAGLYRQNK
jgi:hypothetical protein